VRRHPQARTAAYVVALLLAAAATAAMLVSAGYTLETWPTVLLLAAVAAVAEHVSIRLTKNVEQSISALPMLFAAVLFGPLAGATVGAASMLGDPELISRRDPDRAPRLKWATYTSTRFIGGALTGLAAQATIAIVPSTFGGLIAATLVGALVSETIDIAFAMTTAAVRGGSVVDTARTLTPLLVLVPPLYAPIVALLGFMYIEVSPWTLALFLVPAMAAQRLYALYQKERILSAKLSTANETLERANLQFAAALIATLDARDRYTAGHSAAVAIYSRDIAERMGLPVEIQDHAYLCGLVHDIGKIGLPPGLLEKPGYPDGLSAEAIPLVSRIIAVADAYNAMTSDRPYRDAMPSRVARLRLAQAVDSQFDTTVVAAFEAILAGATEEYRLAKRPDFLEFAQSTYESEPDSSPSIAEVA
jgi:hypothetical protein